ncbi:VOC family protein [Peribacillus sp. FSL R5-0717]
MGRLVHLEIHVDDMERAKKFYKSGSGTRASC